MFLTCVQFPPVDLAEEGVCPQLVARPVLEAEPLVHLFAQQTLADGPGLFAETLRIRYGIVQNPLLHHLVLHLQINPASFSLKVFKMGLLAWIRKFGSYLPSLLGS